MPLGNLWILRSFELLVFTILFHVLAYCFLKELLAYLWTYVPIWYLYNFHNYISTSYGYYDFIIRLDIVQVSSFHSILLISWVHRLFGVEWTRSWYWIFFIITLKSNNHNRTLWVDIWGFFVSIYYEVCGNEFLALKWKGGKSKFTKENWIPFKIF